MVFAEIRVPMSLTIVMRAGEPEFECIAAFRDIEGGGEHEALAGDVREFGERKASGKLEQALPFDADGMEAHVGADVMFLSGGIAERDEPEGIVAQEARAGDKVSLDELVEI
ncbi:hypothetical protein BGE01nite_33620 [Brevifollis gellanilyticus]|uniref:Uncharacterized protein n=1 Tax=Brevifollis gellanilyticus TaxID=748831 RepID=A0A512MCJ5_9BACT|nr:hypothetical protein BGE01nite_33620 [Brevifollis gellanilyticus]